MAMSAISTPASLAYTSSSNIGASTPKVKREVHQYYLSSSDLDSDSMEDLTYVNERESTNFADSPKPMQTEFKDPIVILQERGSGFIGEYTCS